MILIFYASTKLQNKIFINLSEYSLWKNLRYWSDKNPQIVHKKPFQSLKVTVGMGVAVWGVIGHYFLMAQLMVNITNSC